MLQRSAGPVGIGSGPLCNAIGFRRSPRIRSCNPPNRYNRRVRFRYTSEPSRRSNTHMRWQHRIILINVAPESDDGEGATAVTDPTAK